MNDSIIYDKTYFQGDDKHLGSDLCKKYDIHWWSYRYYAGLVKKYCKSGTVLELGCAHGYLLSFLDEEQYRKIGKDLSSYALKYAKAQNQKAELYEGSVEELPEVKDESVDIIISKYVFEHLPHPENAIRESYRVLKKGGYIIISVPNTSSLLRKAKGDAWIGDRDKTHLSVFTPEKWTELFEKHGFKVTKKFSDGFWDVPYIKHIPGIIQLPFFGWTTILQTLFYGQWVPLKLGENLILIAKKK